MARFVYSLCLLAACCAVLVATQVDAHSLTPARAKAISRASIARTLARAHSSSVEFMLGSLFFLPISETATDGNA